MKVLYFLHTFGECNGISVHIFNLIKNLPKKIKSQVIYGKGASLPFFSSLRIPLFELKEVLDCQFDVMHIHGYGNFYSFFGAILAFLKKKPLVWTIHGYPSLSGPRKVFYYFYRYCMAPFIFWKADVIISVSSNILDILKKETNKNILLIPNGVDLDLFRPRRSYARANNVCFVGRLDRDKNADRLLECDQFPILFIGSDEDNLKFKLIAKAKELKRKVAFTEVKYTQMPKVYDKCRYVVLPSKYEGFPLTLLEAVAMGRPFLCTDVGENRKVLEKLFSDPDKFILKHGLAERISQLEKENLTDELAKARAKLSVFSWKKVAQRVSNVYNYLCRKSQI